jgi:hypothetical protein
MMGMAIYRQSVAQVVSQAAIHLHNSMGQIGTALLDRYGMVILNNNALHYADESTLARLANECLSNPLGAQSHKESGFAARAIALDKQYVFIIVGNDLESSMVDGFVASLRQMLPKAPIND